MKAPRWMRLAGLVLAWLLLAQGLVAAPPTGRVDHLIELQPGQRVRFDGSAVQPGAVIGLTGEGEQLVITGLRGTAEAPIVVTNVGDRVRIGGAVDDAIRFSDCAHFQLRGDGDPAHRYGIEVVRALGQGVHVTQRSTDFVLCFLEIHHPGFAGIMAKTDPTWVSGPDGSPGEPGPANRGRFVQTDTQVHDTYIYDCPGEGMYIGHSFFSGINAVRHDPTSPVVYPHELHGVRIHHNRVERSGREGIQVGSATQGVEVFANVVQDSGGLGLLYQSNGVQLGGGTSGRFYGNHIIDSRDHGLILLGGEIDVADNVILHSGQSGIFADSRPDTAQGTRLTVQGNTIVGVRPHALWILDTHDKSLSAALVNNLLVLPPGADPVRLTDAEGRNRGATVEERDNVVLREPPAPGRN